MDSNAKLRKILNTLQKKYNFSDECWGELYDEIRMEKEYAYVVGFNKALEKLK